MKSLSETRALAKLRVIKSNYQNYVRKNFEHKAKDCMTCDVKGECCLDAHFVNVHITKLEALAIRDALDDLEKKHRKTVYSRIEETIRIFDLSASGDTFSRTFSCPLFEKEKGCLVHETGKPIPCIQQACYENEADQPPDILQIRHEKAVERLNWQAYGNAWNWLPLPLWIKKVSAERTQT